MIPAIVAVLVAAVAWLVFHREPEASWLRVDAPSAIVVGEPFTARVTLLEPAEGASLHFDLHGSDARRSPLGFVVAARTQAVAGGQRTFNFTLVLRDRPDVTRVHAVVYLSRSGRWSDAFRVASSESFDVVRGSPLAAALVARPLPVHEQQDDPAREVAGALPREAVAALWLAAAVVAAAASRRAAPGTGAGWFIVLCVVLAAWEALAAGNWFADQARSLARAAGLYEERHGMQQAATVALVGVVGSLAALGLWRPRRRIPALALAGMSLYAVASLADMISLHEVDRMLAATIGPWPLAGLLRLAGACAAAVGAARHPWKVDRTNGDRTGLDPR